MNSTLPWCRTSYPSPRPLTQACFFVPARTQSGLARSAMQSHCNPPRGESSRAGAIAASTDFWSDLDGSSANRLRHLRAERCANWPPLLLKPLSALPGLERTIGLIHLYPTPVATGSRLYMATAVARAMRGAQTAGPRHSDHQEIPGGSKTEKGEQ